MVFQRTLWIKHAGAQLEAAAAPTIITAACVLQNTRFFIYFFISFNSRLCSLFSLFILETITSRGFLCKTTWPFFGGGGESDWHWFRVSYTLSATSWWPPGVTYPISMRRGLPEVAALVQCGASSLFHTCRVSGLNREVADCLCVRPQLLSQPLSVISSAAAKFLFNYFLFIRLRTAKWDRERSGEWWVLCGTEQRFKLNFHLVSVEAPLPWYVIMQSENLSFCRL